MDGDKRAVIRLLEDIAEHLELRGENPFKIRAYQTAARTLERLETAPAELIAQGRLEEVPGIGRAIGDKIKEFVATGRLRYYDELKAATPGALLELIKIPGLGPKKAMTLYTKLGINSIGELEYACRENRLVGLAGFGIKTQERILAGIERVKKYQGQFLLAAVLPVAKALAAALAAVPGVTAAEVAGSVRRGRETVKDVDIVVAHPDPSAVGPAVLQLPGIEQVTGSGATKTSLVLETGLAVDVRAVLPEQFAPAWHHFTGSKEHNVLLRGRAKEQGLKINEYGVEAGTGPLGPIADEAAFFRLFGLPFIPPELREGGDEIEAAAAGRLPRLLEESDIQGVFHVHTTYSDGAASLAAMAAAARERGLKYIGISDHSRTAVYARGLRLEAVLEQQREIARLNEAPEGCWILSGIESDILPDGSLDYPDDVLAGFDFVIASVHSAFRMSEAEMTKRIIRAMENPFVTMLGHPTGRLLLGRDGYEVDLAAVIEAAAATGTVLEINANPYRLDLDWRWCRRAKEKGVRLAVNPDAHSAEELAYIAWGVMTARKGWLEALDIINTLPLPQVRNLLRQKRAAGAI